MTYSLVCGHVYLVVVKSTSRVLCNYKTIILNVFEKFKHCLPGIISEFFFFVFYSYCITEVFLLLLPPSFFSSLHRKTLSRAKKSKQNITVHCSEHKAFLLECNFKKIYNQFTKTFKAIVLLFHSTLWSNFNIQL